jgi:processive 1,2-diacylglycerol beta-glucosyltransferase
MYSFHTGRIRKSSLLMRVAEVTARALSENIAFQGVTDIIATHSFAAAVGAHLKVMHGCRLFVAATDFVLHRRHADANADAYFAAPNSEIWGFALDKVIHPLGLPIRADFFDQQNASTARAELALDTRPVVLVGFGGSGLRGDRHINTVRQLLLARRDLQFVVLTGHNQRFYRRAVSVLSNDVRIVAFTTNIVRYFAAADVYIGRPSGLSTSEALACGLPFGIIDALPGQEAINARVLCGTGTAEMLGTPETILRWIDEQLVRGRRDPRLNTTHRGSAAIAKAVLHMGSINDASVALLSTTVPAGRQCDSSDSSDPSARAA